MRSEVDAARKSTTPAREWHSDVLGSARLVHRSLENDERPDQGLHLTGLTRQVQAQFESPAPPQFGSGIPRSCSTSASTRDPFTPLGKPEYSVTWAIISESSSGVIPLSSPRPR